MFGFLDLRYKCILCVDVMSVRRDNILRHIRQMHQEIPASEVSSTIKAIHREKSVSENNSIIEPSEDSMDNAHDSPSETIDIDEDINEPHSRDVEILESVEIEELVERAPPVINNRVNVIQFVGKPTRELPVQTREIRIDPEIVEIMEDLPIEIEDNNETISEPEIINLEKTDESQNAAESQMFINLPPVKPKYNPIQHYRKMLLLSNDDENDHQQPEETETHDDHPVMHWRKRTQNNYLYRIN